jgi:short-subunit dehydrogenase
VKIAVVTGASSGIGRCFAEHIASDRSFELDEIWLIARREDRLRELAGILSVPSRIFALDLAEPDSFSVLSAALDDTITVSVVVNCAGVGADGPFSLMSEEALQNIVTLNVRAVTMLLSLFSLYLKEGSIVFNISSVAAFLPQPGFAAYAASKSYVYSLSRALSSEWKRRGITVVAVCPNPVETEFFLTENMKNAGLSKLKKVGREDVGTVVSAAIRNGKKGRTVSISSPYAHLIRLAGKVLPTSLLLWAMRKMGFGNAPQEQ